MRKALGKGITTAPSLPGSGNRGTGPGRGQLWLCTAWSHTRAPGRGALCKCPAASEGEAGAHLDSWDISGPEVSSSPGRGGGRADTVGSRRSPPPPNLGSFSVFCVCACVCAAGTEFKALALNCILALFYFEGRSH